MNLIDEDRRGKETPYASATGRVRRALAWLKRNPQLLRDKL
jgi:hypothetical protein